MLRRDCTFTQSRQSVSYSHLNARIYMKAQAKRYGPVHESVVFIVLFRRDIDEDSSKALLASS